MLTWIGRNCYTICVYPVITFTSVLGGIEPIGGGFLIELKQVSKRYQGQAGMFSAVDNVSLTIDDREIFGIIGESGAGKSTLIRFINALEQIDEGEVWVDNERVDHFNKKQLRQHRKDVGMIFQQFNLMNNLTVEDNILLPLSLHHYEDTIAIDELLEFVGLADKRHHYPSQLSGGQKQRVGIARALITKPKILLCDEPTSALDANRTDEIVAVLKRAHQRFGMTIVLVTHELDVIQNLCQRVAIMEAGKVVEVVAIQTNTAFKDAKSYHERVLEVLKHGES